MMTTSNEHNNAPAVPDDILARACNLAGLPYETFLKIKAYLPAPQADPAPAVPQVPVLEERSPEYWASKYPVPLGYALVKKDTASSQEPAVPQGWKLVQTPITEEMHVAAAKVLHRAPGLAGLPQRMLDAMLAATPAPAPEQEPVTTAEVSARYRFLMALLIDRGVLTDRRYSNGTWSLQGIALVDDSGLRGAGRTPEEAIDNAIEMARLNPNDQLTKWRETHEQIEQEVGLTGPVVAWRMRDTGFRRPKYVYFDTKEQAVAHAAQLLQIRDDGHLTELTPLCEASTGTDLLDALRDNSWKLEPFEMPTGQGDADIGWRVVGFYMGKPKERIEATVYTDDPAAAIIAALRAKGGKHG